MEIRWRICIASACCGHQATRPRYHHTRTTAQGDAEEAEAWLLFEITVPITQGTKPVTISVANHTQCNCLSKLDVYKQAHSIIRRALPECQVANRTCPPGQAWSNRLCRCVSMAANMQHNPPPPPLPPPRPSQQHLDIFPTDVCGPDKELDVETCQCICRRGDQTHDCGPNRHLDRNTCQCVCNVSPTPSCPLTHVFNKETFVSGLPARSGGEGVNQVSPSVKKCVAVYRPIGDGWTNRQLIRR
eukprot:superscaffoldBa00000606_g6019